MAGLDPEGEGEGDGATGIAIELNGGGHFLVSWNSYGQDGDFFGVYAQLYHNLGFALGDETLINVTITNFQQFSAIALRN